MKLLAPVLQLLLIKFSVIYFQVESLERRSRRDMSPQGRKRATAMVARDFRTVSGIGQSYHNNQAVSSHVSEITIDW